MPRTDRRRSLLFLSPAGVLGGAEQGLLHVLRCLPAEGYRASVLVAGPGPLADAVAAGGAEVVELPFGSQLERLSRASGSAAKLAALPALAAYTRRLASRLRSLEPDLLWSNGTKFHHLACLVGPWLGIPVLVHLRELVRSRLLRYQLRARARLCVANSRATARSARLPDERLVVVENALDVAAITRRRVARARARAALGIPPGSTVVLAVGALTRHKGQDRLLEAFRPLAARDPSSRLELVGDESYATEGHAGFRTALIARARKLGIEDRVVLRGRVEEPWLHYSAADLFALPSRAEGFGRVYLEAALMELPVLATREGGAAELFSGGEAVLLDPEDEEAWAREILRLADSPSERARLGRAARARAEGYHLGRLAAGVERVLERIFGEA